MKLQMALSVARQGDDDNGRLVIFKASNGQFMTNDRSNLPLEQECWTYSEFIRIHSNLPSRYR